MNDKNKAFTDIYTTINRWIEDIKEHELTDIIEIVEQARSYLVAAESIPEEKIKQFIDNFKYDLREFYKQNQAQVEHSSYLGLMNESLWQTLSEMTDKSQVEWAELMGDFEHDGIYHSGDYIGFGELECCQCSQKITINHLSKVSDCINCGHSDFIRKGLTP